MEWKKGWGEEKKKKKLIFMKESIYELYVLLSLSFFFSLRERLDHIPVSPA